MLMIRFSTRQLAGGGHFAAQQRRISALYITGDKANENYVTIQPYMDFAGTLGSREALEKSILKRGLSINISAILQEYDKYKEFTQHISRIEEERNSLAQKLKKLETPSTVELAALKERGKSLRDDLKALKEELYPVEDAFVHAFLNLPNELHQNCPTEGREKILYRLPVPTTQEQQTSASHLERDDLIHFVDNSRYYLLQEAAEFDVNCMHSLTRHFIDAAGFQQFANPDFVRCVILEANATPVEQYHLVLEENVHNKLNAAYLTGGGAFESFLGAMTKLCIYPSLLPLRLVCCGRNYEKYDATVAPMHAPNLYTATQTNAVQAFAATNSLADADAQLEQILNLAVDFYKSLDVPFRITYADASALTLSECLRARIEVYTPAERRYVCVGQVSHYADFVSRRILFCTRQQKRYHFPHIVGGPVLYTSRLLATLIENGIALQDCQLPGALDYQAKVRSPIEEFKSIFQ